MNDNVVYRLFPEPVFKYKLNNFENLNNELSKYIYKLRDEDNEGLIKSNKGGWHSKPFRLGIENTIQQTFAKEIQKNILDVFQKYGWKTENVPITIQEMWAIINKNDNFNVLHSHPNCYLSAAYYVRKPKNSGDITFFDPKEAKTYRFPKIEKYNEYSAETITIKPEEGDLVIFPSYLYHAVGENLSDENRVVISFNVDIDY